MSAPVTAGYTPSTEIRASGSEHGYPAAKFDIIYCIVFCNMLYSGNSRQWLRILGTRRGSLRHGTGFRHIDLRNVSRITRIHGKLAINLEQKPLGEEGIHVD